MMSALNFEMRNRLSESVFNIARYKCKMSVRIHLDVSQSNPKRIFHHKRVFGCELTDPRVFPNVYFCFPCCLGCTHVPNWFAEHGYKTKVVARDELCD